MVTQDHVIAFVGNMTPLSIQGAESYLQQVHIPVIGGDLVSPDWFTNPDFFPQGTSITNQVVAMVKAAVAKGHKKFALVSCVESAVICNGATSAFSNEVKQAGATLAYQSSATLTAPSYTAQCVGAQQAGADFMYFESDGASLIRMADNCASQGYHPAYADTGLAATPTLLGDSNLNGTYFPSPVFPFTVGNTPATAAYQQAQKTYDPSLSSDGATALEWTAGELAVAASKDLGAAPTSAQFLQGLYSIQNNNLGGIAPPLTFTNGAPAASSSCSFDFDIQGGQWSAPSGATASC
jgi:branched-chain amino acid transport system substrate-binding protein